MADWATVIASKLAPTGLWVVVEEIASKTTSTCTESATAERYRYTRR